MYKKLLRRRPEKAAAYLETIKAQAHGAYLGSHAEMIEKFISLEAAQNWQELG
jgi:hypothetical protein